MGTLLKPTFSIKYKLFAALKEAISGDDISKLLCSYLPDQVLVRAGPFGKAIGRWRDSTVMW